MTALIVVQSVAAPAATLDVAAPATPSGGAAVVAPHAYYANAIDTQSFDIQSFGDPHVLSWGIMLNAAFQAGAMRTAWWWVLPPGVALSALVISVFMITRAYEEMLNPRLRSL